MPSSPLASAPGAEVSSSVRRLVPLLAPRVLGAIQALAELHTEVPLGDGRDLAVVTDRTLSALRLAGAAIHYVNGDAPTASLVLALHDLGNMLGFLEGHSFEVFARESATAHVLVSEGVRCVREARAALDRITDHVLEAERVVQHESHARDLDAVRDLHGATVPDANGARQ